MAGPGGAMGARYYRPFGANSGEALPAVVYFHGGGWTCGDLDTHDSVCRGIAAQSRFAVVAIDYHMGPEHRFPAAVEDALAAARWMAANAGSFGIQPAAPEGAGLSARRNPPSGAAAAPRQSTARPGLQRALSPL